MNAGDFYRIEFRMQNNVRKYYLVREIFSDAKKFAASRLITSGTPPTRRETDRCASLYGFDLELKCITKAAKYRAAKFRYDTYDDTDAVLELERFRLLTARKMQMERAPLYPAFIASFADVTFDENEVEKMLSVGTIPRGKTLSEVNLVQNLFNAWNLREAKMPTVSRLYKLSAVLSANRDCKPLSLSLRPALEKCLQNFSGKIKDGFYPFEQCLLLYQDLSDLVDDPVFAGEVYGSLLSFFGYPFTLEQAQSFASAVSYVEEENPALEYDVRRLNEALFTVKTGGRQKQLELF